MNGRARQTMWTAAVLTGIAFSQLTFAAPVELPEFARLVRVHGGSVVNISTLQRVRAGRLPSDPGVAPGPGSGEFGINPFDDAPPSDGTSLGSGFVISKDGYILTCAHVVEESSEILVRLSDRREYSARLVGADSRTDIALLKIDATVPAVTIGAPDKLEVGEWVLAIGSPFGFHHSATSGIVSAKGRSLPHENYTPFIQTDVAINPGNSGGPLFNLRGEVVGVNSQIYSRNGGFMGVSFAIPIDLAMRVVAQLKRDGRMRRGWLGVNPQEVTRNLALAYGLEKPRGALIADILPESPAARSEMRPGDIVLEYEGKPIQSSAELPLLVGQTAPTSRVKMTVYRRGAGTQEIQVTVGELREEVRAPVATEKVRPNLALTELTERQRRQDKIANGIVVESLDMAARQAGLRVGDVVTDVDGKRVNSVAEFRGFLAQIPAGKHAVLRIRRGSQALFVAIALNN